MCMYRTYEACPSPNPVPNLVPNPSPNLISNPSRPQPHPNPSSIQECE